MEKVLPKREQVKEEHKWAIEDIYKNDQAWEEDYKKLEAMIPELSKYRGRLGESADVLLELFQKDDEISMIHENVYGYANQKLHEDTGNPVYQNMTGKADNISVKISMESSYITPELLSIPKEKIRGFLDEKEELKVFEHFFDNLFRQKEHVLSDKEEEILASAGEVAQGASDIFNMFNNADLTFSMVKGADGVKRELTHGNYITYLQSSDRKIRKSAFKKMQKAYKDFENTLASSFAANIKKDSFYAKTRKYPSTRAQALSGSNIPQEVYDNLIEAVHNKLPLMHRYISLRKKVLDVNNLHMYDLYVPMVKEAEKKIPFEQAKEIVLGGLKPLGEDYLALLKDGFDNRWIDVYENQGKRSGAYSWGPYGTHPYVLLNYQDNLNNVFTLAHEMGHALHSYYSDKEQPYVYASYKIFVAEVASTCNESLLIQHLISNSKDEKEQAYLINYFLEQFRGTVFRQTMFAEFERITHSMSEEGQTLTAQALCDIYYDLNKKYYGDEIVVDEEIAIEWARIPHFYRSFYVYQYATGFSAAIALSKKILNEGEQAANNYKQFLKGGSSDYPIELLKIAGVDMTDKKVVEDALDVFGEYLGKLEKLYES